MLYSRYFDLIRASGVGLVLLFCLARAMRLMFLWRVGKKRTALAPWDFLGLALLVVIGVQKFLLCPFVVTSRSMQPALNPGDIVLATPLRRDRAEDGDVVFFDLRGEMIVKRIFATEGETVSMPGRPGIRIPQGYLYLLGDNRGNSTDSRAYGAVARERVWGRAVIKVWPLREMRIL